MKKADELSRTLENIKPKVIEDIKRGGNIIMNPDLIGGVDAGKLASKGCRVVTVHSDQDILSLNAGIPGACNMRVTIGAEPGNQGIAHVEIGTQEKSTAFLYKAPEGTKMTAGAHLPYGEVAPLVFGKGN